MPDQVTAAITAAAGAFVPLAELHAAADRRIAELTGTEAALVTSGAAGAIVLGAAACIAGTNAERIRRLPDATGIPNRVLVLDWPGTQELCHPYGGHTYGRQTRGSGGVGG